jgi:hypothetical protein
MAEADSLLDLAEAMVEDLEPYLQSRELHWPLPKRESPRLSLGTLQLTLDELESVRPALPQEQQARLKDLHAKLDSFRAEHASAAQRKARAEQQSRLRLWAAYLEDLTDSEDQFPHFPRDVRNRLIASRLSTWAASPSAAAAMAEAAAIHDSRLRNSFRPGLFVWSEDLRRVYPEPEFWYLYGGIRGESSNRAPGALAGSGSC